MVRIALSDPDGEVCRYSIAVDAEWAVGKHIHAFAAVGASYVRTPIAQFWEQATTKPAAGLW
jgi:hypothetical protein